MSVPSTFRDLSTAPNNDEPIRYIFRRNDLWCSRISVVAPFGAEYWQPADEPHETKEWQP